MIFHYHSETDSLYIAVVERPEAESRQVADLSTNEAIFLPRR